MKAGSINGRDRAMVSDHRVEWIFLVLAKPGSSLCYSEECSFVKSQQHEKDKRTISTYYRLGIGLLGKFT